MSEDYLMKCFLKSYYDSLIDFKIEEDRQVDKVTKDIKYILIYTNSGIFKKEIKYA